MPARLAIVSSRGATCGIASYSRFLRANLEASGIAVDHITLDEDAMRSARRADVAEAEIDRVAQALGAYDLVNIQFEPGILASQVTQAFDRLRRLVDASRNLIFTAHTIVRPAPHPRPWARNIELLLTGRRRKRRDFLSGHREAAAWVAIYDLLRRYQRDRRLFCFVHTRDDRLYYESALGIERVIDHPLSYVRQREHEDAAAQRDGWRRALCQRLGLDHERDVLVEVFGFISRYKGIETAVRAIARLPERFKLIIFGGLHPATLPIAATDPYLSRIVATIAVHRVDARVRFVSDLDDRAFRVAIASTDAAVFPYLEVGQRSSGPIKVATELGRPVLCSRTRCFLDLAEYYPGRFNFFDVGNYLHLAQLLRAFEDGLLPARYDYPHAAPNAHSLADLYARCLDRAAQPAPTPRIGLRIAGQAEPAAEAVRAGRKAAH